MEQNKLTTAILQKYFGCPLLYMPTKTHKGIVITEYSINTSGGLNFSYTSNGYNGGRFGEMNADCLLILKNIEDVSDVDCDMVAKIINDITNASHDELGYILIGKVIKANFIGTLQSIFRSRSSVLWNYQVADYLRASKWEGKPKQAYNIDNLHHDMLVDAKTLTTKF